jgi:hypothetical protein
LRRLPCGAVRASLLASATTATLAGRRSISLRTHSGALGALANERAPLTSSVRTYGSPRLWAVQLNQWKTGPTVYRALRRLGAPGALATYVARHTRRWWHCSLPLSRVQDIAYFDRLGVPKFCRPQLLEPSGADPHAGWCGRGPA